MTKNLKLSFILYIIFYCVIIAWSTLYSFFNGVGINFVALIVALALLLTIKLSDEFVSNRTKELFWASVVFVGLEFLIYLVFEFTIARGTAVTVFWIFQRIFTGFALLVFAYVIFRFICETKGVKFTFVEVLLGNEKIAHKKKSNKELTNGSLEDKPNKPAEENSQSSNYENNDAEEIFVQETKDEE